MPKPKPKRTIDVGSGVLVGGVGGEDQVADQLEVPEPGL